MKTNFDDIVNKTNIRAFVKLDDLVKGKRYDEDKIELMYQEDINRNTLYHFEVDSESKNNYDIKCQNATGSIVYQMEEMIKQETLKKI